MTKSQNPVLFNSLELDEMTVDIKRYLRSSGSNKI
jgi:hypothetical protein